MASPIDDRLKAAAEAGEPDAQYRLAAALSARGDAAGADAWLRRAADGGFGDALYTLATRGCGSLDGIAAAHTDLRRAAEAGSLAALRLLGVLAARGWGGAPDRNAALDHAIRAGEGGDAMSMAGLAIALAIRNPDHPQIVPLLSGASENGSGPAAAARVRRYVAGGDDDPAAIDRLVGMLERSRYPNASSLRPGPAARSAPGAAYRAPAIDWDGVRDALAHENGRPPEEEILLTEPDAKIWRKAFPPEACEYVIASAVRLLAPSRIVDPATGAARADPYRSSLTAVIAPVDYDAGLIAIAERLAAIAGEPITNAEFLSVLRYAQGQEYRPHFDWLPEGEDLQRGGQRRTTALLYLNDGFEGGETAFTDGGAAFRGAPGDVLVFRNTAEDGARDMTSRHASLPVTSGAKWIASQWYRETAYRF